MHVLRNFRVFLGPAVCGWNSVSSVRAAAVAAAAAAAAANGESSCGVRTDMH